MKIAIIGVGRLGSILAGKLSEKFDVLAIDVDPGKIKGDNRIKTSSNVPDALSCDAIIVSVKPVNIRQILEKLKPLKTQLLISTAAGVPIKTIKKLSNSKNVSRIMPNINIETNEGVIAYCGEDVQEIFEGMGKCMRFDESLFDAITSISGSGPAFIWHFAKAFEEVAGKEGIDKALARKIIGQLLKGCGEMMLKTDKSLDELIATVASPGGTTEQGLRYLDEKKVNGIIAETIERAIEKAKEIGKSIG